MLLDRDQLKELYGKRAKRYDLALWAFRGVGLRVNAYKRMTVAGLALKEGDTVIDLGCGTGHNFAFVRRAVGPLGRVIGVDLTEAMLEQARRRVVAEGWVNVDLVQSDLADYRMPVGFDAALSTLAITLVPEYDKVIERVAGALKPGGRIAILDLKKPDRWPAWLIRLAVWLNKPYGVSLELADRRPWESVRRHLNEVMFRELYFGALYLSIGEVPDLQQ